LELGVIGLIGDPVAHSLSPAFQQAAFDALGLPIRYELWETPADAFPERLQRIRAGAALGANVTVPHKERAFGAMDTVSDVARRIGAVNTVVRRGQSLHGDNTDAHGFVVPLLERGIALGDVHAVVVGAGGAARAVIVALLTAGARQVTVVNRTAERAERLATELDDARLRARPMTALDTLAPEAGLLVNATALGWADHDAPVTAEVMHMWAADALAYDLTYRDTPFLRLARAAGLETLDGLGMLVHQGARSFALWTNQAAPVDLMWQAAIAARAMRGG
jgi:shikimate dehydrogenase